jgi:hypothetical protein
VSTLLDMTGPTGLRLQWRRRFRKIFCNPEPLAPVIHRKGAPQLGDHKKPNRT